MKRLFSLAILASGIGGAVVYASEPKGVPVVRPNPPTLVSPKPDEVITDTMRPTFKWKLGKKSDGAQITLCSDADCKNIIVQEKVNGTSYTPPNNFPTGDVYIQLLGTK